MEEQGPAMRVNWRRGFNRVFALALLGWAAYVFVLGPGGRLQKAYDAHFKLEGLAEANPEFSRAEDENLEGMRRSSSVSATLRDRYVAFAFALGTLTDEPVYPRGATSGRSVDWLAVLVVVGVFVLPPALAYGFVEAVWRTVRWVFRGFGQPAG